MRVFQKRSQMKGFTLIETIVYVSFLAVFSVLIINNVVTGSKTLTSLRLSRDINTSATTIMERFVRDIRIAYDVDQVQSSLSTNPGRLTLKTTDTLGVATTTEFYVDAGRILVKEGGVDGYLSSRNVNVDLLVFDFVTNANTSAVTIRLQLGATRGSVQKTETFYSTTVLRGSY